MGVKERRTREKQELRQGILDAARDIATNEGWQAVTIRRIADRIEYSPPTIYEYFSSKDDILLELMRMGFKLLLQNYKVAQQASSNPVDQVRAICEAWWGFAWSYPDLYQVIHGLGGVDFLGGDKRFPEGVDSFIMAVDVVRQWTIAENLKVPHPVLVDQVRILWATMHGIVSLTMGQRIGTDADSTKHLIDQAVLNFITALRTLYTER